MKRTLIRYKAKADRIQENTHLIEQVFRELHETAPVGVRYAALRLEDGTFVHIVETEDGAAGLSGLTAFRAFQSGIGERCEILPQPGAATIVGNYRMLDE